MSEDNVENKNYGTLGEQETYRPLNDNQQSLTTRIEKAKEGELATVIADCMDSTQITNLDAFSGKDVDIATLKVGIRSVQTGIMQIKRAITQPVDAIDQELRKRADEKTDSAG